ncbi:hypothetical protein VP01_2170g4 [Puccinia sorghi]|uniref:Vacuolar-sorting protein SNF8 n=1 Tax=Puccinia sorghi TaxID=27349 RepID=A0A0L6V9G3_9BASI|nr:hypothetical protein VP01_2170g4 [Puccinia sorghi]
MRRGVGISSLERTTATTASYSSLSSSLSATSVANLQAEVGLFQGRLQRFAAKHGSKIRSDPEFRGAFSAMCSELGVDPLAGGRRGLWDRVGFGDWTFALAVQIVDLCLHHRLRNGGLHEIHSLILALDSQRYHPPQNQLDSPNSSSSSSITEADILRAIKSLEPLGSGYSVISIGDKKFLRSVPAELDNDSLLIFDAILSDSQSLSYTSEQLLQESLSWSPDRVKHALNKAVLRDSMLWIDDQADDGTTTRYYAPVLFDFQDNQSEPPS